MYRSSHVNVANPQPCMVLSVSSLRLLSVNGLSLVYQEKNKLRDFLHKMGLVDAPGTMRLADLWRSYDRLPTVNGRFVPSVNTGQRENANSDALGRITLEVFRK